MTATTTPSATTIHDHQDTMSLLSITQRQRRRDLLHVQKVTAADDVRPRNEGVPGSATAGLTDALTTDRDGRNRLALALGSAESVCEWKRVVGRHRLAPADRMLRLTLGGSILRRLASGSFPST